jgi:folate-binding protein YgfZ
VAARAPIEIDAEYRELLEGAGLVERSHRALVEVAGPDAAEFLQGQLTNDVAALAPGEGCYAAMLNPKGRILADMRVLHVAAERFLLDTESSAQDAVLRDLRRYKIGRRVEVLDRSADSSVLSLVGPRAEEVVAGATGLRPGPEEHSVVGDGIYATRTDVGVDVIAEKDAASLREALLDAGARAVSLASAEIIRVGTGRPRHGLDMSEENLPAEAGIVERAVSFTKGCYVGQEPVARMHYRGHPNRHLRGLRLAGPAEPGTPIFAGENEVGRLGSAVVSPALGPIALALVRREVEPGDEVSVGEGGPLATVIELPFASS